MGLDQITSASPGTSLIARSSLAASHWEMALAATERKRSDRSWPSPPLTTLPHWLAERWDRARRSGSPAHDRCLLSRGQSARLWQRIIESSPEGPALISPGQVARWAQQARQTLSDHGLTAGPSRRSPDPGDSDAFERWHREFEQALEREGWVDPESLLHRLNRLPVEPTAGDLLLLDPDPAELPERQHLGEIWRASGRGFASVLPDSQGAQPALLVAADPADELVLAAEWAAGLIEDSPGIRVAVIVADLAARGAEVARVFVDRLGGDSVSSAAGQALRETGIVGAALNALTLLSSRGDFSTLSRWLRSPFFATADRGQRARAMALECRLRADLRSQQDFLAAYRWQGLRAEFQRALPEVTARLDAALDRLPRRASLSRWVEIWQATLRTLRWQGIEEGLADPVAEAWDGAQSALAELTPLTGVLDLPAALDELDRVVGGLELSSPPRLRGVHLLQRIGDVGPGFAGAWVTGLSDQRWPEPAPANPLVAWSLQLEHGMPAVRPDQALAAAAADLDRLGRRVPALVLSCPDRILDQPQVPHPRFGGWSAAPRPALGPGTTTTAGAAGSAGGFGAQRIGRRARETLTDPAPPLAGRRIPGATRTLDLQSSCPLRAFVEARLGVQALEPTVRGIDGRVRGNLLHRILELLHRPGAEPPSDTAVNDGIAAAVAELLPPGDDRWRALVAAEQQRARRLLADWMTIESRRAPFATIAVEQRAAIEIGGWQINSRIDRIDRLDTGEEILIDYKTGKRPTARWGDDRLGDCQLPLYAQRPGPPAAAIVLAVLGEEGAGYRALGTRADALPGRAEVVDAQEWRQQMERWRKQLLALIEEFAAGDTRIAGRGEDLEGTLWSALARTARLRL